MRWHREGILCGEGGRAVPQAARVAVGTPFLEVPKDGALGGLHGGKRCALGGGWWAIRELPPALPTPQVALWGLCSGSVHGWVTLWGVCGGSVGRRVAL